MTSRLPIPGQDSGTWGNILNDYLSQAHNGDGTLKTGSVGAAQLQNNAVADATSTTKGVIQLAGDIGGTAAAPQIAKIQGIALSGTPTAGQTLIATSGTAASWSPLPASASDYTVSVSGGTYTAAPRPGSGLTAYSGTDFTTVLQNAVTAITTGGTGNGKTTMLFYEILQDIRAGNGIAVLDPHGDLAERILRHIPEERVKDVIYLNPDDLAYPIGMNLLELSPDLEGDDLLREKDLITEAAISVLRKIFSEDDSGGHRIEYVLRNTIQTALTLENSTLFTIFELLNDAKYRRKVVKTLEDKSLKDFWNNELGKAGDMQKVKMAAGITAKIGRFLFSASARRMIEQPKSTINFEDILATRKILICNFSKGLLGEDTSALFGTTVLAKLQTASLRRARIGQGERTPYYLYVDEFQNFATTSFVQMLSEARKYKLFLTMAEQSTSQQDEQRLVDIILANVGTVVCFRSGSPSDERLVLPLFMPFIQQGEIANLPAYSYYIRISAVNAQEPMSGVTIVVEETGNESMAKRVVASSRQLYAKKTESEEQPSEPKQKEAAAVSQKPVKSKKKRTRKKSDNDELSAMKSVT